MSGGRGLVLVAAALLATACTPTGGVDWDALGTIVDAVAEPARPGRPPGTLLAPGQAAWVRDGQGSTVRLDWPEYCRRYADQECDP